VAAASTDPDVEEGGGGMRRRGKEAHPRARGDTKRSDRRCATPW
jgi:hypothetical protein